VFVSLSLEAHSDRIWVQNHEDNDAVFLVELATSTAPAVPLTATP
jgi:hypothetical protein